MPSGTPNRANGRRLHGCLELDRRARLFVAPDLGSWKFQKHNPGKQRKPVEIAVESFVLTLISRADFSKLPSDCAVVGCGTILRAAADLGGIKMSLQFVYGLAQLIDAAKEADDVTDLAMV